MQHLLDKISATAAGALLIDYTKYVLADVLPIASIRFHLLLTQTSAASGSSSNPGHGCC